jgi:uncharacterized lipoprotein YmbA
MKPPRAGITLVLMTPLLLAACGGKRPPSHYYLLGAPAQEEPSPSTHPAGLDIGVKAVHVDPPYDRDSIVYRVGADSPEVGFYAYHLWAAPLSRMLPGVVAAALEGTEGIGTIEPVVPGRSYSAYVTGRVLTFEEVDLPEGQRVRISLSLSLRLADATEVWTDQLSGESGLQTDRVSDIIDAMRSLLNELLREARTDLATALDRRGLSPFPEQP